MGRFQAPGSYGADVVVADGQPLGIPLSFGGPHLGIFATRTEHVHHLPGRLVGETVDGQGRRGYVLTLAAREQHIRRAKATSNICTNAGLMALAAATYLATLGEAGLRQVAELCYYKSHYAAAQIGAIAGLTVNAHAPQKPFFKEFVVSLPCPVATANRMLFDGLGIIGGYDLSSTYPELKQHMLVAVTELSSKAAIDRLVDNYRKCGLKDLTVELPGRAPRDVQRNQPRGGGRRTLAVAGRQTDMTVGTPQVHHDPDILLHRRAAIDDA